MHVVQIVCFICTSLQEPQEVQLELGVQTVAAALSV